MTPSAICPLWKILTNLCNENASNISSVHFLVQARLSPSDKLSNDRNNLESWDLCDILHGVRCLWYAALLFAFGNVEEGYRYGQLALKIAPRISLEWYARCYGCLPA
jgi:hypothetical protein